MPAEQPAPTWDEFVAAWELFSTPMICALIAGAMLGFLSVYIFLRRMVFVSAAVTQSAGLGVALAFYLEIHLSIHLEPVVAAAVLSVLAILVLAINPERLRLTREALLGLIFATAGGATVLVGDRIAQEAHDIQSILFGTAVLVSPFDLYAIIGCSALFFLLHVWWFRGLTFTSFDSVAARVQGLPVRALHSFVLLSIGIMVGVSARALGALPVFALSTLPAMAALALGCRLRSAFILATVFGGAAGFLGYALSFFLEFPVGATQTIAAAALVAVGMIVAASRRGLALLRQ